MAVCCGVAGYHFFQSYYVKPAEATIDIPAEFAEDKYYYEMDLIAGGKMYGFRLKTKKNIVSVTNRKGIVMGIKLAALENIKQIEIKDSQEVVMLFERKH